MLRLLPRASFGRNKAVARGAKARDWTRLGRPPQKKEDAFQEAHFNGAKFDWFKLVIFVCWRGGHVCNSQNRHSIIGGVQRFDMIFFSLTDFIFVNFVEVINDQFSSSSSLLPRNAPVAAEVVKNPLLSISSSCNANAGGGGDNCCCIIFILFCYIFSGDYCTS
jgi:hypothetical protein